MPMGTGDARDLLLGSGAAAVEVIVSLMEDKEVKPELRLKAAESILDRISGKNALEGGTSGGGSIVFEGVLEEWSR
ncbi:MAG: hypothetical protein IKC75_05070 [Clostridia bacterium]|nr:hypothetical protein [Clostridia bacterium]